MKIENSAMAGTLESSDAQVTIEPGEGIGFLCRPWPCGCQHR